MRNEPPADTKKGFWWLLILPRKTLNVYQTKGSLFLCRLSDTVELAEVVPKGVWPVQTYELGEGLANSC